VAKVSNGGDEEARPALRIFIRELGAVLRNSWSRIAAQFEAERLNDDAEFDRGLVAGWLSPAPSISDPRNFDPGEPQ
jgi:hypothetical protein